MAVEAGAYLKHMRFVQVHPTSFVDPAKPNETTKFLAPEGWCDTVYCAVYIIPFACE